MSAFRRIISGVACIGNGVAIKNVAPIAWPIDPIGTFAVVTAVCAIMLIQAHRALTGEAFQ